MLSHGRVISVWTNINTDELKTLGSDAAFTQAQWKFVGLAVANLTFHIQQCLFKRLRPAENVVNNDLVFILSSMIWPDCCARAFYWQRVTFLADTKSYEITLHLCFTMPAVFIFTMLVPNELKKLSTLSYHNLIHVGIVDFDGRLPCWTSNKPRNHGVPFATAVAWLWQISKPYP